MKLYEESHPLLQAIPLKRSLLIGCLLLNWITPLEGRNRNLQIIDPAKLSCAQCVLYRYDYCQPISLGKQLFTDIKGTCGDSTELNKPNLPPVYNCSDMFLPADKSEWLTFLPCYFSTYKCGVKDQVITLGGESTDKVVASGMELGDICMYEIHYNGTDTQQKIWFDTINKAEVTLIDGMRVHPWVDPKVLKDTFVSQSCDLSTTYEFGDSWYNVTYPGRAYIFVKSTDSGGAVTFNYGFKPLFPKWAIYLIAIAGGLLVLICLFICCCWVRRQAKKRAAEGDRVRKYQAKDDDKLARFKYGRQSNPIQLPELAENGDEMKKPEDDWQGNGADGYDDGLEFQ